MPNNVEINRWCLISATPTDIGHSHATMLYIQVLALLIAAANAAEATVSTEPAQKGWFSWMGHGQTAPSEVTALTTEATPSDTEATLSIAEVTPSNIETTLSIAEAAPSTAEMTPTAAEETQTESTWGYYNPLRFIFGSTKAQKEEKKEEETEDASKIRSELVKPRKMTVSPNLRERSDTLESLFATRSNIIKGDEGKIMRLATFLAKKRQESKVTWGALSSEVTARTSTLDSLKMADFEAEQRTERMFVDANVFNSRRTMSDEASKVLRKHAAYKGTPIGGALLAQIKQATETRRCIADSPNSSDFNVPTKKAVTPREPKRTFKASLKKTSKKTIEEPSPKAPKAKEQQADEAHKGFFAELKSKVKDRR